VNCCFNPAATLGLAGVTLIDTSAAVATVRVVEPVIDPDVALMVVVPCATVVARPPVLIVAMLMAEEPHVTDPVRSLVLLSE
jgi:hypothetical protein